MLKGKITLLTEDVVVNNKVKVSKGALKDAAKKLKGKKLPLQGNAGFLKDIYYEEGEGLVGTYNININFTFDFKIKNKIEVPNSFDTITEIIPEGCRLLKGGPDETSRKTS